MQIKSHPLHPSCKLPTLQPRQSTYHRYCPEDTTALTEPGKSYAIATWKPPLVDDNVDVAKTTVSHQSGAQFPLLSLGSAPEVVTVTTWDLFGNRASCTFTVSVEDGEDPTVVCAAPVTLVLGKGAATAVVPEEAYQPSQVQDNSEFPTKMLRPLGDLTLEPGVHRTRVVVADAHGRESKCTVVITVRGGGRTGWSGQGRSVVR